VGVELFVSKKSEKAVLAAAAKKKRAAEKAAKAEVAEVEEPKKEKAPNKSKSAPKNTGPDRGTVSGIRSLKNRLFCAGVVLKERGLDEGVTDDLVKLVDKLCVKNGGTSNLVASKSQLVLIWHGVNGFTAE